MNDKEAIQRLAKEAWERAHPPKMKPCKGCKKPTSHGGYCKTCVDKLLRRDE